jgi:hypothetical protein
MRLSFVAYKCRLGTAIAASKLPLGRSGGLWFVEFFAATAVDLAAPNPQNCDD